MKSNYCYIPRFQSTPVHVNKVAGYSEVALDLNTGLDIY